MSNKDLNCDINTGICSPNLTNNKTLVSHEISAIKNLKITYYYDAFCGWCFGFSKAINEFRNMYINEIDFEVVSGGLFLDNRIGKINDVAPYVKNGAYKNVEEITGVQFGPNFIDKLTTDENIWLDSTPPAIALGIIKENAPKKALDFAELLLETFNYYAKDVRELESYKTAVLAIGYNFESFKTQMKDLKYLTLAQQDFNIFSKAKISGMPTLLIEGGNKKAYLSNGYASFKDLESRLNIFKDQIK